jgi:hypothetical protein
VEQHAGKPWSKLPVTVEDDQTGDEIPHPVIPLGTQRGLVLSNSERNETLAASLEVQFQPVNYPSVPAGIEMFDEAMRAYSLSPQENPN